MPGKRFGKRSFDTDDEEVPRIIRNENDSDGELERPKRRTCCVPLMIVLFLIVIGAAVGLLLYFFLFKPDDTVSPTPSPVSSPATARSLGNLCTEDNTSGTMQSVLSLNEPVFIIEMVNFSNNEKTLFNSYEKFLNDNLDVEDGEVVFEMEFTDWDWDKVLVTKYRNGEVFRNRVLENEGMANILAQRKSMTTSTIWAATLNTQVEENYPELMGQPGNPERLLFHGLKFLGTNGRSKVEYFDVTTKNLKSSNGVFAQGWLAVNAACIGEEDEFDQFRIESVRGLVEYGKVLAQPGWVQASIERSEGIDYQTFSEFTENFSKITNLYN